MQGGLEAHGEERGAAEEEGLELEDTIPQEQGWGNGTRPLLFLDPNSGFTGPCSVATQDSLLDVGSPLGAVSLKDPLSSAEGNPIPRLSRTGRWGTPTPSPPRDRPGCAMGEGMLAPSGLGHHTGTLFSPGFMDQGQEWLAWCGVLTHVFKMVILN